MTDPLADEIRDLRKHINNLESRQSRMILDGKVAEVDGNRVRLELVEKDEHTGERVLSPWVRTQEIAGDGLGGFSLYQERRVGQNMKLLSLNGEIGPNSLAIDTGHNDENPAPGEGNQTVLKRGEGTITMNNGSIVLTVGGNIVTVDGAGIHTSGPTYLDGGGKQVSRVDDLDDDGDKLIEGAPRVYA